MMPRCNGHHGHPTTAPASGEARRPIEAVGSAPHLQLARRRARARGRSAGAAMFIVAVTLGLLAAMGVYGLSATAYDIRAAGHVREAAQVQHTAEQALIMTAETLQPGTAGEIVRVMQLGSSTEIKSTSRHCKSAKPISGTASDQASMRVAEACFILSPDEMKVIAPIPRSNSKEWNKPPFTPKVGANPGSFGDVDLWPFLRVELTNPIDWETPAGFATSSSSVRPPIYTQVRATVFIELKPGTSAADARDNHPAQVLATGRGRLVVGPYSP